MAEDKVFKNIDEQSDILKGKGLIFSNEEIEDMKELLGDVNFLD